MDKYSIIIPAAGIGKRMKVYGPKSLIQINEKHTILSRQLMNIGACFKNVDITIIGGYQYQKLERQIPKNVKLIINEDYENNNVISSIGQGLSQCNNTKVIIIYGDLIFNKVCLNQPFNKSAIIVCDTMKKEEVGCVINNKIVQNIFYQLPNKWAQITYFTGRELEILRQLSRDTTKSKWFGFEAINEIINYGGQFTTIKPKRGMVVDIDSSYDLKKYKNENSYQRR